MGDNSSVDGGRNDRQVARGTERVPPLNLTKEEAEYLWEMMKREIVKESVQYGDDRGIAESLHTKVHDMMGVDDEQFD